MTLYEAPPTYSHQGCPAQLLTGASAASSLQSLHKQQQQCEMQQEQGRAGAYMIPLQIFMPSNHVGAEAVVAWCGCLCGLLESNCFYGFLLVSGIASWSWNSNTSLSQGCQQRPACCFHYRRDTQDTQMAANNTGLAVCVYVCVWQGQRSEISYAANVMLTSFSLSGY